MAHESTLTGGISEQLAQAMFMSHGFNVFTAVVPEVYDLIVDGTDEAGNHTRFTVQVKTMKVRNDRGGELVIKGANKDGTPYSVKDVDYLFGVHLPTSTGFLIANQEKREYWARDIEAAREKWTEFTLNND